MVHCTAHATFGRTIVRPLFSEVVFQADLQVSWALNGPSVAFRNST